MNSNFNNSAYRAALDKRALERAKDEESAATLARAERIKLTASDKVVRLENDLEAATTEQAHMLEFAIAAGGPTGDASQPNLDAHAIALELNSARLHDEIAGKALIAIKSTYAQR
jgi:hypothetical protein